MLAYAVVTPARDELDNLPRLAESIVAQTRPPAVWLIVDNASTDGTRELAVELAELHSWIVVVDEPGEARPTREAPIARAFRAGLSRLPDGVAVVVKVDADISFEPDYFERLIGAFEDDPRLGMASGSGYELNGSEWRQQHMTGDTVWGASRAYRLACLDELQPLDDRVGWDGLDAVKATMLGWRTETLVDLPFKHHRLEGLRDGRRGAWDAQGRLAYYMGYRPSYLLARTLFRAVREPAALAMAWGYAAAAVRREPRCPDEPLREYLRRKQALRDLPGRLREARGRPRTAAQD